jgi:hypothetical protein
MVLSQLRWKRALASEAGQVLLIAGCKFDEQGAYLSEVNLVDLATGACSPQPALLDGRGYVCAARLPDGRIICAGGGSSPTQGGVMGPYTWPPTDGTPTVAGVWGPPRGGASNAARTWTQLPATSVFLDDCCGCVMSDGRFAVLRGNNGGGAASLCEALLVDEDPQWHPLPPMHHARSVFTCAAVGRCIFVVGGDTASTEVYDEALNRWIRLRCDLPGDRSLEAMGSALSTLNPKP